MWISGGRRWGHDRRRDTTGGPRPTGLATGSCPHKVLYAVRYAVWCAVVCASAGGSVHALLEVRQIMLCIYRSPTSPHIG